MNDSTISEKIPLKEKLAYGIGCFGQNLVFAFMGSFLLYFYTDFYGLMPAAAATLLMVARIWDAINDPIMGVLVDKTQSRWGKFKPYLLFSPLPFAALAVLCFTIPDFLPFGKLVYAYITYILFGMVYTASDVPYWAMSSAITQDPQERNSVIVFPRLVGTMGAALAIVATLPIIYFFRDIFAGSMERGFQMTAVFYGIITVGCFLITFFFVKERVKSGKGEHSSLRDIISAIFQNKPLLLVIVSGLLAGIAQTTKLQALIYYAAYNLADEGLYIILVGINIPFLLIGIALVPVLTKRLGKKKTYIIANILFAASSVGFYLSGWENFPLLLFWNCVGSLGMAVPMVIQTSMIADTIEYAELKTGKRSEGTIFSTQTFMAKLTAALAAGLIGFTLSFLGFKAGEIQADAVLKGIHAITSLFPFFGSILAIVPIMFYDLTEERHAEIVSELAKRKNSSQ